MVGQKEYMGVHDAWLRGKSISEIARQAGRERKEEGERRTPRQAI